MRILLLLLCASAAATAQTVQYRSRENVEYRSLADSGPVARAQAALAADPRNIQKHLDLGAAQAGARQFREAIDTYTRALIIDSTNSMLYRWRGHRYLSVREPARAWADLIRALELDSMNYGGRYHLGVLHYLRGEFREAADQFRRALRNPPNAGELAGSTDWLWMSLMRAGMRDSAARLLAARPDTLPIANAYATRLKLYRGEIMPEQVFTPADTADVQIATLAYGLGNWYLVRGDTASAVREFRRAIASGGWPGFAFMAAEAELRRLRYSADRPSDRWLRTYLEQMDVHLRRVRATRDSLVATIRRDSGTARADSAMRRGRTILAARIDGAASRIEDSTFATLVAPFGGAVRQIRRAAGVREDEHIPRDSVIAATVRRHLLSAGIRVMIGEGRPYLVRDDSTLLRHVRRFLTPGAVAAAELFVVEQVNPSADDGAIMIPMDSLGERLARAEAFARRYPGHPAAADVHELSVAYLRWFISGNANTSWFERETRALLPEAHQAYQSFVTRHPNTKATREVMRFMSLLATNDFRRTPEVDAYLRSFWQH